MTLARRLESLARRMVAAEVERAELAEEVRRLYGVQSAAWWHVQEGDSAALVLAAEWVRRQV